MLIKPNHIYHFANYEEGFDILKSYEDYSLEPMVHIIISSFNYRAKSKFGFKNLISGIKKKKYQSKFSEILETHNTSIEFVDDVNAKIFIEGISQDSIAICTGFPQIFDKALISKFEEVYNLHQSLLPFYKGPVPCYWVIKNKERWTGFTIHKMTTQIDSGEILYQEKLEVKHQDPLLLQKYISFNIARSFQQLLKTILSKSTSWHQILNAEEIYIKHPDYLSFPNQETNQ